MKKLIEYHFKTHSRNWFNFRYKDINEKTAKELKVKPHKIGIGASSTGNLLRLTYKYDVLLQFFNQLIGKESVDYNYTNSAMFHGTINEDMVGALWQCYDGTKEGYIDIWKQWKKAETEDLMPYYKEDDFDFLKYKKWEEEYRKEHIKNSLFRTYTKKPFYIVNPKYPRLYCSLDGWANPGSVNLITGEEEKEGFPVEMKTMSIDRARSLGTNYGESINICGCIVENHNEGNYNLPLSYITQVHQQMMIMGVKYAEIPIRIGSNIFEVNKFVRSDSLCKLINNEAEEFCQKVDTAKKALKLQKQAMMEQDTKTVQECEMIIQSCEPKPVNETKFAEYVSDNYDYTAESTIADKEDIELAKKDELFRYYINEIKNKRIEISNILINKMKNLSVEEINLEELGRIDFKFATKNSTKRSIRVRIKKDYQPDDVFVKNIISKLPNEY